MLKVIVAKSMLMGECERVLSASIGPKHLGAFRSHFSTLTYKYYTKIPA